MPDILGPDGSPLDTRSHVELVEGALREAVEDRRLAERRAETLAYAILSGQRKDEEDLDPTERIAIAKKAREVWSKDPQAGAAADLLNDFVFGRGIAKPRARWKPLQEVLDEAWNDPDNKLTLTSFQAQTEKNLDLTLQSNVFLLAFADGDDGKVKLSWLNHDTVKKVMRDPDQRGRVLFYIAWEKEPDGWDFDQHAPRFKTEERVRYYPHWENVDLAEEAGTVPDVPEGMIGKGWVYHVAVNKTSEMAFGMPTMRRTMRWYSAYNEFMSSRVDIVKAAAAFLMKRKVKGGEAAVARMAVQSINRRSELASSFDGDDTIGGPRAGSILNENEGVSHEAFNLSTNAGNALQDSQAIRSQISASTHFPQHYLGDAGSANLATATSMELPVLKHVEARQEVWEGVYRWFFDLVIKRAQEVGKLPTEDELRDLSEATVEDDEKPDLTYEFSLPSPLKRMMSEMVNSVANIAKTFDPNGTNIELTRELLTIALREGLEVQDANSIVERVFPPGYVDPLMAASLGGGEAPPGEEDQFAPEAPGRGVPGQQMGQANPWGGPSAASSNTPAVTGDASGNPYGVKRGARSRTPEEVTEARYGELPPEVQAATEDDIVALELELMSEVYGTLDAELEKAELSANGNGANGNGAHA